MAANPLMLPAARARPAAAAPALRLAQPAAGMHPLVALPPLQPLLEDAPEAASNAAGAAGSEPPATASAAHQPTAQEGAADAGAVRAPPLGVEDGEAGAGIRAGDLPAAKRRRLKGKQGATSYPWELKDRKSPKVLKALNAETILQVSTQTI